MAEYDVANFIGGFGEAFLKVLQDERKRREELEQFNRKLAEDRRQFDLTYELQKQLRDRQLKEYEMDKELKEYDISKEYQEFIPSPIMPSAPEGFKSGKALNKQFEGFLNPFDPGKYYIKPVKTDPKKYSKFIFEPNIKRWVEAKYLEGQTEPFEYEHVPELSGGKSGQGSEEKELKKPQDFDTYVSEVEKLYNNYKMMSPLKGSGDIEEPTGEERQKIFNTLKGKTEGLLTNAGLDVEKEAFWKLYKERGYKDFYKILDEINNFRTLSGKPPLNNWQEKALKIYFETRTPEGYKAQEKGNKFLGIF